jgi:hypothetical protein
MFTRSQANETASAIMSRNTTFKVLAIVAVSWTLGHLWSSVNLLDRRVATLEAATSTLQQLQLERQRQSDAR